MNTCFASKNIQKLLLFLAQKVLQDTKQYMSLPSRITINSTSTRAYLRWMKLLATSSVVLQDLSRFKLRTLGVSVSIHAINEALGAYRVQQSEWTANKGRESDSKNSSNVTCTFTYTEKGDWVQKTQIVWLLETYHLQGCEWYHLVDKKRPRWQIEW